MPPILRLTLHTTEPLADVASFLLVYIGDSVFSQLALMYAGGVKVNNHLLTPKTIITYSKMAKYKTPQ